MIRKRLLPLFLMAASAGLFCITAKAQTAKSTMNWDNEPKTWKQDGASLLETVPAGTDYWRTTHYGFIRDNGPFHYESRSGNFEAKVKISGRYHELYHQAGLMIRIDDRNWIKTGIEFVNGHQNVSAVVTRGYSDWSVLPRTDSPASIWMRLQRFNDTVQISYSLDGAKWSMIRLAYFPPNVPVKIGMVTAAPGKESFDVRFDEFNVKDLTTAPKED